MGDYPIIIAILLILWLFVLSWGFTCGIVFAILTLLGKEYTWRIGTIVWLGLVLLGSFVHG